MKVFTLYLASGQSKTVTGNNMIGAFIQSGGSPDELKTIASYQEGSGPKIIFSN
jgi:hypothetical protein